jgi:hypothetical protein
LTSDVSDPLGTSLLRMCGKWSCFCRVDDISFGDNSGDDAIGDSGFGDGKKAWGRCYDF